MDLNNFIMCTMCFVRILLLYTNFMLHNVATVVGVEIVLAVVLELVLLVLVVGVGRWIGERLFAGSNVPGGAQLPANKRSPTETDTRTPPKEYVPWTN